MNDRPETSSSARQWVEKGEHDLINAEYTLTLEKNCPLDTVCFHAQQCAEKVPQGVLSPKVDQLPKDARLARTNAVDPVESFASWAGYHRNSATESLHS